jgi:hypothetical protein
VYISFSKFKLLLNVQNLGKNTYWVSRYTYLALFPLAYGGLVARTRRQYAFLGDQTVALPKDDSASSRNREGDSIVLAQIIAQRKKNTHCHKRL